MVNKILIFLWWKPLKSWLNFVTCLQNFGFGYIYIASSALGASHPLVIELKNSLTIQWLAITLDEFAQVICRHLCGPIFRVLIFQPLRPFSFHSLIKLILVLCTPENSWIVPWITLHLYCVGAQLLLFNIVPVSFVFDTSCRLHAYPAIKLYSNPLFSGVRSITSKASTLLFPRRKQLKLPYRRCTARNFLLKFKEQPKKSLLNMAISRVYFNGNDWR